MEFRRVLFRSSRADKFDVKFSYGDGDVPVCSSITQREAEHVLSRIERFMPTANAAAPANAATFAMPVAPNFVPPLETPDLPPLSLTAPSSLALIVANLLPLFGVMSGHLSLVQVMILFWSESAIIGFFTLLKMGIVGRWKAVIAAPFFAGHYGGFMAVHFIILYSLFGGGMSGSAEQPALTALAKLYKPLWLVAGAL